MTRRSEATRRRLLAAARDMIAEQGLDISLAEVAERAGVTRMTLYRHFGPRRELLLDVLLDDVAPVARDASALLADTTLPLPDRVHGAMCEAILSLSSTPLLLGLFSDGAGESFDEIDPSGALRGLLTTTMGPVLGEANAAGLLRGTPDEALRWVARQIVAGVVNRQSGADPQDVSRQLALFFLPSLLQVDLADCERLAAGAPVLRGGDALRHAANRTSAT